MKIQPKGKQLILMIMMISSGFSSICQTTKPLMIFNPKEHQGVTLNFNMDIESFSYDDYLKCIVKLNESDQHYRLKLAKMKGKENTEEYDNLIHLMEKNDRSNEILLLRLVKKFGWPCSTGNNESKLAWYTVWHADHIVKTDFFHT